MQLGEDPARVFTVGSPGIDAIKRLELMDRDTIGRELGMPLGKHNALVTFHPVTVEMDQSVGALDEMFAAISALDPEFRVFFTLANADAEGRALNERIRAFVARRPHTVAVASLGQLRYISLMKQVDVVIGNSSSGIYEAPSTNTPSVDIGDRQKGRRRAESVFHADPDRQSISAAIAQALKHGKQNTVNPYGDGETSQRVATEIAGIPDFRALLKKRFHDVGSGEVMT
jgi:UDP-N-acetylglucosamine 2-epimerase (non-hydrolysing)/GDP/UDP-N,N'-diacetylbacillosamine 2-epimerase (hydrolysing)